MDEETRRKIKEIREKYKDNADVQTLLQKLTELELKLQDADILAMTVDILVKRGLIEKRGLDARSLIADARLDYGNPWEYEHADRGTLLRYKGGIEEVQQMLSED